MPFLFCWYGISISYPILFYWNMSRFASSFDNLQPDISSPIWDNRMTYRVCAISAYKLLIDLCFWMVNVRAENWLINKLLTSRILFPPSFRPLLQFPYFHGRWLRGLNLDPVAQRGLRSMLDTNHCLDFVKPAFAALQVPEAIAMDDTQIPSDTNKHFLIPIRYGKPPAIVNWSRLE